MNFNETNYRRLRAYLPTMPKFNWGFCGQDTPADEGCVACACARLRGAVGEVNTWENTISEFLGCSNEEGRFLFWPPVHMQATVHAAVARLDEVAARYGVTPESSAPQVQDESADEADRRPTLCQASDSATRPDASRSDSPTDREAAFLAQVRADAAEIRAAYPVEQKS